MSTENVFGQSSFILKKIKPNQSNNRFKQTIEYDMGSKHFSKTIYGVLCLYKLIKSIRETICQ